MTTTVTPADDICRFPIALPTEVTRPRPGPVPCDALDLSRGPSSDADDGLRTLAASRSRSTPGSDDDAPAGPLEGKARVEHLQQTDRLKADEIYAAMEAERQASRARIQAMLADAQTEWLQIWEEVMLARQKVVDDFVDKWCKLLLG